MARSALPSETRQRDDGALRRHAEPDEFSRRSHPGRCRPRQPVVAQVRIFFFDYDLDGRLDCSAPMDISRRKSADPGEQSYASTAATVGIPARPALRPSCRCRPARQVRTCQADRGTGSALRGHRRRRRPRRGLGADRRCPVACSGTITDAPSLARLQLVGHHCNRMRSRVDPSQVR